MYTGIRNSISQHINLREEDFEVFRGYLESKTLKKREILLSEGEVCTHAFFIRSGCLRYYYIQDGQDVSAEFFFENCWYTDFESYISGKPTRENIQALEETELLMISRANAVKLYAENPPFERWGRIIAEQALLGVKSVANGFFKFSPEERYLKLMAERPQVIARIPQHYIASYLGIKPESLSRIRKRLASKV